MNKKLLALLLALLMVAMSAVAMADDAVLKGDNQTSGDQTEHSFVITKNYDVDDDADETVSKPAQTFNFNVTADEDYPAITVNSLAFTGDNATKTSLEQLLTIPEVGEGGYEAVPAVYEYEISEDIPATKVQGITYDQNKYYLKVTVVNTAASGSDPTYDTVISLKLNNKEKQADAVFNNTYSAGSLTITKKLAGNAAVSDDTFEFTITFAPEDDKTIASDTITAPAGATDKGNGTYTVVLGHGESATFTNIPDGTSYTVSENTIAVDTEREYEQDVTGDEEGTISANVETTVAYVNTLTTDIDTGVSTDTMPYILMLAFVAILAVAFVAKKRSVNE